MKHNESEGGGAFHGAASNFDRKGGSKLRFGLFTAVFLLAARLNGALVLTAPSPQESGFFDGNTGTSIGSLSSEQLPEEFGVAGHRVYGSATTANNESSGASLNMLAIGGVSGTLETDTILQVLYHFRFSTDVQSLTWTVQGAVGTSNGGYFGEAVDTATSGEEISGGFFLYLNGAGTSIIPAGTTTEAWILYLQVGEPGVPGGPLTLTLEIPPSSVDIVAYGVDTGVPEPVSWLLSLAGMAALAAMRRNRHGKPCNFIR